VEGNFGEDTQPDVAFALEVGFSKGVTGEWVVEEVAGFEEVVEPSSALSGVECGGEEFDSIAIDASSELLGFTDVFAIGGVVHG
jgi:hypothetical protein